MEWFVIGLAGGIAALAAVGLRGGWRNASWAVALGVVSWLLAASAAVVAWGDPAWAWQRAVQHRHAVWVLVLGAEAAVAGGALALAGWREARTRAALGAWLACGFAGLMLALSR